MAILDGIFERVYNSYGYPGYRIENKLFRFVWFFVALIFFLY